ncbi:uncharacterized protein TRIADDRAFT_25874 [Trichoplax adhaerens]|uniref:non-specific serine/threonine protein kinase n=1 Tax=Trichoplax adhaerens TaxID=10228 RepID=B3RXQ5_TRIAD|nr:hypothetical protein TRIADDRAFT_25874 [Trichoplax adhaerens]EDV24899.1 hypothetical protein TRIADDRAFT_25874 [Trichoplax adhaerens]|eukprot:XP_002112789.1 hypothetical protein TRIADDRAFT_25874 [Trichoplax adhaerens]
MPPNDDSTRTLVPQSPAHAKKLRGRFNFPPDVTKKYLETMYRKTLMYKDEREKRQQKLEEELEKSTLAEKDKSQFRKALLQHETNLLRGKRSKVTMDNFIVISGLGCGAYGQVYLVQHKSNKKHFAMKAIKKDNVINEKELQRIRIERDIMIAAEDCQPWIVKMECCFQDSKNLFFIMEYMVGGDLLNLLIKEGVFKEETAIFYIAELVNAVEWIHSCGFVHRDIKPDNVLIDGRGHIKVADFGLASSYKYLGNDDSPQGRNFNAQNQGKKSYHRYHSVVGTPNYIAPEVLQAQEISRACDIWSIGVILYEMVYGKPPFYSKNVEEVPANIRNWRQTLEFPPKKASDQCKELIQKLICDKEYRLTIPEIKEHGLFKKIDFDTIRELEAPIKPTFDTEGDTRNFDAQAIQEVSNFDFSSENKSEYITRKYMNFTYVSNRGHFS